MAYEWKDVKAMKSFYQVILRPVVSEKSKALEEVAGRYTFEVASSVNKFEIKEAVKKIFNVDVLKVRTLMVHGKMKRFGRFEKKKPNWKKAIVTLAVGQKIELFQLK